MWKFKNLDGVFISGYFLTVLVFRIDFFFVLDNVCDLFLVISMVLGYIIIDKIYLVYKDNEKEW